MWHSACSDRAGAREQCRGLSPGSLTRPALSGDASPHPVLLRRPVLRGPGPACAQGRSLPRRRSSALPMCLLFGRGCFYGIGHPAWSLSPRGESGGSTCPHAVGPAPGRPAGAPRRSPCPSPAACHISVPFSSFSPGSAASPGPRPCHSSALLLPPVLCDLPRLPLISHPLACLTLPRLLVSCLHGWRLSLSVPPDGGFCL